MNGLSQILVVLGSIGIIILVMRWLQRRIIHEALTADGFRTQAVATELDGKKMLLAKGPDGETLAARVTLLPENLSVLVKVAAIPISHAIIYWFEFADGTRVNATPI